MSAKVQGLIVDITVDQFRDGQGPIIVAKDRSWHSGFRVLEHRNATNRAMTLGLPCITEVSDIIFEPLNCAGIECPVR